MTRTPARITLHVGELVLVGFDPRDRAAIGLAVQAELARLLATQGLPPGWTDGARLVGTPVVAPGADRAATGAGIAHAAFGAELPRAPGGEMENTR